MDINNLKNCTVTTYKNKAGEVRIYFFVADGGHVFYDKRSLFTDEKGAEYYEYFTAFAKPVEGLDTLEYYECVPLEDGMTVY